MQCTKCGADLQPGATVCPSCEQRVVPPKAKAVPSWLMPAVVAVVVVLVAIGGWFAITSLLSSGNTPDGAALRMLQAYAAYDATTMLDNVTHASLSATDVATFEKQAADLKVANKSVPQLKDIKVTGVTIDSKNPNSAVVHLTETVLDSTTGAYAPRNETLTVVKQGGKWLVKLF